MIPKSTCTVLSWSFADMVMLVKNLSCLIQLFSAEAEQGDTAYFSSHTIRQMSFLQSIVSCFLHFPAFCWFYCLKIAPKHSLKCCVVKVFLDTRLYTLWGKKNILNFIHAWVIMLLAMGSVLMNQLHIK